MIQIGIVGHRFLGKQEIADFVNQQCISILQKVKDVYRDVVALSAIAAGADTIFAEAAVSLNLRHKIVRPFKKYITDFETPDLRDQYLQLQKTAIKEILLPHSQRTEEAYFDAMQWIVINSDLIIAVWDGKDENGKGGTADAVKHVLKAKQDWIHIDTGKQLTKFYLKKIKL